MRISDWSSDVCSSDLTFMQSLLALRAGALALACVLAPVAHAADTANLLTGIPRLACEATLCLSSSLRPGQCGPSLDHYFDIRKYNKHGLDWSATVSARRSFLSQCPASGDSGMSERSDEHTSELQSLM